MLNLNPVFLQRMKTLLGEEFDDFLLSLNMPLQKSIYVNNNKISTNDFLKIFNYNTEQIPYEQNGFYIDNVKLGRHPLHHAGAFYMQEPSAMFTVNSIKFKGDECVLDMCAAPGGKSIQIANKIPNGVLVSNEINKQRCQILYSNIERMGLNNVIITNESTSNIANAYQDCFDVCLVDAPCSGEGMFRRGEEVVNVWNENLGEMNSARQLNILLDADKTLKQNGYLIYSTCTYNYDENEAVILKFLNQKNYKLINIDYTFSRGKNLEQAVRLYPHKQKGEGQFVCVMQKLDDNIDKKINLFKFDLNKREMECVKTFLNKNLNIKKCKIINQNTIVKYNNFYYLTNNCNLIRKNVNYISLGVRLGEFKKNYFEPHHNIFTALGGAFINNLNFDFSSEQVLKYLKGETIDVNLKDGYGAILINGCALGGFKVSAGKFKNHYPKGLRNF